MKLILDTHALLWAYWNDKKLSSNAIRMILDPANSIFVSAASHWEIAIKMSTKKLNLREPFLDFVQHAIIDNGFTIIPIEPTHTEAVISLPHHHRDPFDRMIIAQAIVERLPVIGADAAFDAYPVQRLW